MGEHEPIITKETFDEIAEVRKSRAGKGYRSDVAYPFTGVLRCARCGHRMIGAKRKRKDGYLRFYRCQGRFTFGVCKMPILPESVVEDAFLTELLAMVESEREAYRTGEQEAESDDAEIYAELGRLNSVRSRLKKLFTWGDIEEGEYLAQMDELKERQTQAEAKLRNTGATVSVGELEEQAKQLRSLWPDISFEVRKQAIAAILESMTVEITKETVGGPGNKPEIEITGYQFR